METESIIKRKKGIEELQLYKHRHDKLIRYTFSHRKFIDIVNI